MGLLKVTVDNTMVTTSYMGSKPVASPVNDAWINLLKSIYLGGDKIEIVDERDDRAKSFGSLSVIFDTDTAERVFPVKDEASIDTDDVIAWLEDNPEEMRRIIEKMKK